ncbi:MAG: histidine--tRNA ligase [Candidatus Humimicrobiaceae bacterium]
MAINSPRGTADIYGEDIKYRDFINSAARNIFKIFNYNEMITPAFEYTEVFSRSIGEETDIVQKEMYTFNDRKGRSLTLRPEGTAAVVRAAVQKKMFGSGNLPIKIFYIGNMFRYERPQKGRMREFWQLGVEALGCANPVLDAEIIWMLNLIFKRLGFKNLTLLVNSIGCLKCRKSFIQEFKKYLTPKKAGLCGDCTKRLKDNPLRIFDCKVPECVEIAQKGPKISDYLCSSCKTHFKDLTDTLSGLSVDFKISDSLVRGFDYYTKTVFEIISNDLESAQNALGGGGRYDNLIGQFGGPEMPAIGFAIGIDRTIMLMKDLGIEYGPDTKNIKAYLVSMGDDYKGYMLEILKLFRDSGISCDINYTSRSIKAEIKKAEKLDFDIIVFLGEDEYRNNSVTIKDLKNFKQYKVSKNEIVGKIFEIAGRM